MRIDNHKREEWEAHIHFFTDRELVKLLCEFVDCYIGSVTGENIKRFVKDKQLDMNMFAVWLGHTRGDYYGNFSLRRGGKIIQKGKGFHCGKEWWDWVLGIPLDWYKIMDTKVRYTKNIASAGIDLPTGEFITTAISIDDLSGKRFKK